MRVDRTLDKMTWTTNSSSDVKTELSPSTTTDVPPDAATATLIEVKPSSSEAEGDTGVEKPACFDLPVLVGDAHSLFRFTMFDRVPPKPVVKKGKKRKELNVKTEDNGSHEDTEVKSKLLSKVQNDPPPESLSVTIEYKDSTL